MAYRVPKRPEGAIRAQPKLPQCLMMDTLLPLAGKGASARAARGARRTASGSVLLRRDGRGCDLGLCGCSTSDRLDRLQFRLAGRLDRGVRPLRRSPAEQESSQRVRTHAMHIGGRWLHFTSCPRG